MIYKKWIVMLSMLPFMLLSCGSDKIAGNASQTGNPTVAGILYAPGGNGPAVGVRVAIRPKKSLADTAGGGLGKRTADTASVVTDNAGRYAFDTTLDTGTYIIEASSGNDAVLIDSVVVKIKTVTDTLPPDTLKPAGAIKGVIKLSEGGDPRKVFVLAFGIDRFARINTDGSFKFSNLAEAAYDLRIISSLDDYGVLDTPNIAVTAAETTDVKTIELPFTGIPTPKNIMINYDTLKQIVTLSWSKADTVLVKSYNVYRRNVDSNTVAVRINVSPVVDTVYRDSTGVQNQSYEYLVAAVNKSTSEGRKSTGVNVKMAGAFVLADTIGSPGSALGQFTTIWDMTLDSSGNLYVVSYENNTGNNPRIQKFETVNKKALLSIGTKGIDSAQFNQPKGIAVDANGLAYVTDRINGRVQIFDSLGNFSSYFKGDSADSSNLLDPKEIAVFQSSVYVADYSDNEYYSTVKKFDITGKFIKKWGQKGDGQGQFRMIWAIKTTPSGEVITLDENGIQFFTSDGQYESRFSLKSYNTLPQDLYLADSLIYLTAINDNSTYEFLIVNMKGTLISKYSLPAFGFQIAVREKTIFISDFNSGRILVFKR